MNNSFYNDFAARFAASTLPSLVRSFNSQVGKRGFNSVRAVHDQALIDELVRRGVDVSAVFDGTALSFAHHVELDNNRLEDRLIHSLHNAPNVCAVADSANANNHTKRQLYG